MGWWKDSKRKAYEQEIERIRERSDGPQQQRRQRDQMANEETLLEGNDEVLERAQVVNTKLSELQQSDAAQEFFAIQCGLIFLLQQDFYQLGFHLFNLLPKPDITDSEELVSIKLNIIEKLHGIGHIHQNEWTSALNNNEIENTIITASCFNACEFWHTVLMSNPTEFEPLKLCVKKNFSLISMADRDEVFAKADQSRGMFLQNEKYEFVESDWPYENFHAIVDDYKER